MAGKERRGAREPRESERAGGRARGCAFVCASLPCPAASLSCRARGRGAHAEPDQLRRDERYGIREAIVCSLFITPEERTQNQTDSERNLTSLRRAGRQVRIQAVPGAEDADRARCAAAAVACLRGRARTHSRGYLPADRAGSRVVYADLLRLRTGRPGPPPAELPPPIATTKRCPIRRHGRRRRAAVRQINAGAPKNPAGAGRLGLLGAGQMGKESKKEIGRKLVEDG